MEDLKFLRSPNKENSTHTEKIRRISQNLQQLTLDSKSPQPQRNTDQMELRLKQLEERLANFQEFDEKRFGLLQESVDNSKKSFERERKEGREAFEDFKTSFEFWQSEVSQKLQNLAAGSNNFESEVLDTLVGGLAKTTSEELSAEETKLEETRTGLSKKIGLEIQKNRDAFSGVGQDQEAVRTEVSDGFDREAKFIADKIVDYRASKKEVEDTIFGLVKEFVEKTQAEIEKEHRERVRQEDQILTLLDKATSKLNHLSQI